jgi:uncharacterized protein (TIGR02594 family)
MQMQLAYRVARTQEGETEKPGDLANKKIQEYASTTTLKAISDEISWCSSFVNWCYIISGILLNPIAMRKLLTGIYSEAEIMAFFDSTRHIAALLNMEFNPANATGIKVRMPTRSAAARSWNEFGQETKEPKEGDLVVLWRDNPKSWKAHVAFFVSKGITSVNVFGGNQGNKVCLAPYSRIRVLSYRVD